MMHVSLILLLLPVCLRAAEPPLTVEIGDSESGAVRQMVLQNHAVTPVTAYVYTVTVMGPIKGTSTPFRDTVGLTSEQPILPGERRTVRAGFPSGGSAVLEFHAAIFADGSSFGDMTWVRRIYAWRSATLAEWDFLLAQIDANKTQPDSMLDQIDNMMRTRSQITDDPDRLQVVRGVYAMARAVLKGSDGTLVGTRVATLQDQIQRRRSKLVLAVQAASGGH